MMKEMNNPDAMVIDSALKKAPVTPVRKASGKKMMMVEALEPISGRKNSVAAFITCCSVSPSWPRSRRTICSIMTMASSMIRPTAAAMPPSVMMLKLMFSTCRSTTVAASTVGTTMMAISVILKLRKKNSSTRAAKPTPIKIASRTLLAEATTSWLWSYQLATFTPGGSCG